MTQDMAPPPHFIVFLPGYMGSYLRDPETKERVWIDFDSIPLNPFQWDNWLDDLFARMDLSHELEPDGIVDEVLFLPPWVKQEHYSRLFEALERFGYKIDPERHSEEELDVYSFAYDWRQDNRHSARLLGEAIERWRSFHPDAEVWLMGHSNGGIVARWYIEKEGGHEHVTKLFLFGSPYDGAPKTLRMMMSGLDTFLRRRFNAFNIPERTRDMFRSYPSAYHILPSRQSFLKDGEGNPVDPFEQTEWLESDEQRSLLADGRRFNEELGTTLSAETFCFFGRRQPTISTGVVRGGNWNDIEWMADEVGDGTVPERSAIHPEAERKLPFASTHGNIYVDPAVLEFLKWELVDKYGPVSFAVLKTGRLELMFEPEGDLFEPGEPVPMWATVHTLDGEPEEKAAVSVRFEWEGPLPGASGAEPPGTLPTGQLAATDTAGRWEGSLNAPEAEGYYRIQATITVPGEAPAVLEELIAIEATAVEATGADETAHADEAAGAIESANVIETEGGAEEASGSEGEAQTDEAEGDLS